MRDSKYGSIGVGNWFVLAEVDMDASPAAGTGFHEETGVCMGGEDHSASSICDTIGWVCGNIVE